MRCVFLYLCIALLGITLNLSVPIAAGASPEAAEATYDPMMGAIPAPGEVLPLTQVSSREELIRFIEENQLSGLAVAESSSEISGQKPNGEMLKLPISLNPEVIKELQVRDVYPFQGSGSPWGKPLFLVGLILAVLAPTFYMLNRSSNSKDSGPQTSVSGYQYNPYTPKKDGRVNPSITFSQVAGLDEAKEELREILLFLTDPDKFYKLGAKMPRGIILYGPPGTGKTLLARALAGEAQASFFAVSGSEFVEKYVGVGASRIRSLFENARRNSPAIVFIDEIDAVGRKRSEDDRSNEEKDRTLNQLLVELDGFNSSSTVVVIGATNRLDMLDKALLRPGRFDRHIAIDAPTLKERLDILHLHAMNKPFSGINLESVAQRTSGLTGADLANLCNEAAIIAARNGKQTIENEELEKAIDRVTAGLERKAHVLSEREKRLIAFHEGGHAMVTYLLKHETISRISILPRGKALGFVLQTPETDKYIYTRQDLIDKMLSLLGGRAAEEIVFGEVSTGAKNDLEKATDIALKMVTEFGMGRLGLANCTHLLNSYQTPLAVHEAAEEIVEDCYRQALELVERHRSKLNRLAQDLMIRETMTGEEVRELLAG